MKRLAVTPAPRILAIGDIHGCATALAALLAGLKITADDTVIMLGDAIDRGPDSRGVIEQLLALRERTNLVCILGNHEQMLLDSLNNKMPIQEWLIHGGAQALDSYGKGFGIDAVPREHVEFIQSWGDLYQSDNHFFAHGNYFADRPLNDQPWDELRWQSLKLHTPGPHESGRTAVLGHTSNKQGEILNLGHLVCIDTYCCGGFWLTALDVVSGRVWQSSDRGDFRSAELPPIQSLSSVRT
jgi:serine/threonine protein phosphatase 1